MPQGEPNSPKISLARLRCIVMADGDLTSIFADLVRTVLIGDRKTPSLGTHAAKKSRRASVTLLVVSKTILEMPPTAFEIEEQQDEDDKARTLLHGHS